MMTYCLVCKKNTDNFNARMKKAKNGRMVMCLEIQNQDLFQKMNKKQKDY